MTNETLTKLKVEFANSMPKEFALFLAQSNSEDVKQLRIEAMNFFLLHANELPQVKPSIVYKSPSIVPAINEGYNPNASWMEKIKSALTNKGNSATTSDVVDFVLSNEPNISRERATVAISTIFSRDKGKNFNKTPNEGRGYFYHMISKSTISKPTTKEDKNTVSLFDPEYRLNMTWKEKIIHLIKANGGKATPAELTKQLMLREPTEDKKIKENKIASMSSVLSQNAKADGMFSRIVENGITVYGIR